MNGNDIYCMGNIRFWYMNSPEFSPSVHFEASSQTPCGSYLSTFAGLIHPVQQLRVLKVEWEKESWKDARLRAFLPRSTPKLVSARIGRRPRGRVSSLPNHQQYIP